MSQNPTEPDPSAQTIPLPPTDPSALTIPLPATDPNAQTIPLPPTDPSAQTIPLPPTDPNAQTIPLPTTPESGAEHTLIDGGASSALASSSLKNSLAPHPNPAPPREDSRAATVITPPSPAAMSATYPEGALLSSQQLKELSEPADLVGHVIGGFKLSRLLGMGGMGAVYEGIANPYDSSPGTRAAIKIILPSLPDAMRYLARFEQEAQVTEALKHEGIVGFLGSGQQPVPYLALEYIEGQDLGALLKERRRLELPEALGMIRAILRPLGYAHEQGVVHRDLKPDNILLGPEGRVVIADFGIGRLSGQAEDARLTRTGQAMGTPYYMAPEQIDSAKHVDPRSDLYAIGAILFQLLAGRPPFTGGRAAVFTAHIRKPPPDPRAFSPTVPKAVAEAILRLLAKEPGDRYASAREVLEALEKAESSLTVEHSPGQDIPLGIGDVLGGWELHAELGAGGMGKVFAARREGQQAALKVLASAIAENDNAIKRFEREAEVMSSLASPNVVTILGSGLAELRGRRYPFMAMELAPSGDLAQRVERDGPLPPAEAVDAAIGAALGLEVAHQKDVIHRDVKPENLLLSEDKISAAAIRVTDFGVAALSQQQSNLTLTTAAIGSPFYMAPEQARGSSELDGRADLYALGATLYYLLTGARMFAADTAEGLLLAHAQQLPERADLCNPKVPEELALIVDWAVLKRPQDRPDDMASFRQYLEAWRRHELDRSQIKDIRRQVRAGRKPFEARSAAGSILLVIALIAALASAGYLGLREPPVDPFRVIKLRIADGQAKLAPNGTISRESLRKLDDSIVGIEKSRPQRAEDALSDELLLAIEGLHKRLDEGRIQVCEEATKRHAAAPLDELENHFKLLKTELGAVSLHLQRYAQRAPAEPRLRALRDKDRDWVKALQARISKLALQLRATTRGALLLVTLQSIEQQVASRAFENAKASLPGIDTAVSKFTKDFGPAQPIGRALRARVESARKIRSEGAAALQAEYQSLAAKGKSLRSKEALAPFKESVLAWLATLPAGNPSLKQGGLALTKVEDPVLLELTGKLKLIHKRMELPQSANNYAALILDLQPLAEDRRFNNYPEQKQAAQLLRQQIAAREAAASAAFAALVQDQDKRLKTLDVRLPELAGMRADIDAFATKGPLRGWNEQARKLAVRGAELDQFKRSLPSSLLARARQTLCARPRSEGSGAFLTRLAGAKRDAETAASFPLHDAKEQAWLLQELGFLSELHTKRHMASLPGGEHDIGFDDPVQDYSPRHRVRLKPYRLDRLEVTVGEYQRFMAFVAKLGQSALPWLPKSTSRPPHAPAKWGTQLAGDPRIPVSALPQASAIAFARWAGKRLPSEQEWEAAARRGGDGSSAGPFPWGEQKPSSLAKRGQLRFDMAEDAGPGPVGKRKNSATRDGIEDLAGNLAEWTSSPYGCYPKGKPENLSAEGGSVVVRGGSFRSFDREITVWYRSPRRPSATDSDLGFRCAVAP